MDRDEITRQGKQIATDLRDTVSQKVSENEGTIKSTLDKAARWVDEKTGGKYADQIGKAQTKVDEGIGWVASQGGPTATGEPGAPGAAAGDPAPGSTPPGPITPDAAPGGRTAPPGSTPPGPITPDTAQGPKPTAPDTDAPRPPQV